MYHILGQELDSIGTASIQGSLHLAFFGAAFGASLSLWITIITVDINSNKVFGSFLSAALLSSVLAVYFFIRSVIDLNTSKRQIKNIKEGSKSVPAAR